MLALAAWLIAAPSFQIVFGSERFTGLSATDGPEDLPKQVLVASDGGIFVVASNNHKDGTPKPDTLGEYCTKLDDKGGMQWWVSLGALDTTSIAAATPDGGILFAGPGKDGIKLIQYDKEGNVLWKRTDAPATLCDGEVCASRGGSPTKIIRRDDGGYSVLARVKRSKKHFEDNAFQIEHVESDALIRYDAAGKLERAFLLDALVADGAPTALTSDGGLWTVITTQKSASIEIRRYDPLGKRVFARNFSAPGGKDLVATTTPTQDGGIIVAGWYRGTLSGSNNSSIITFEKRGSQKSEWNGTLPGHITAAAQLKDGSFLFNVGNFEGDQVALQHVTVEGKFDWNKPLGNKHTSPLEIVAHPDGSGVMVGYTKDFGAWYSDIYLVKIDASGQLGPDPKRLPPVVEAKTKKKRNK